MTLDPNLPELIRTSSKHCAALFFAQLSEVMFVSGSAKAIEAQGTITFVEHAGRCFGITNGHVTKAASDAALADGRQRTFFIALKDHRILNVPPIFTSDENDPDFPYDIAIFDVPREAILAADKIPLSLDGPANEVVEGAILLAVGFPGVERRIHSATKMAHGLYHVIGTCVAASDRRVTLHADLPGGDLQIRFGGMSGGPIFSLSVNGSYDFVGIVFLGRGFGDVMVGDTQPNPDIWIYGFPFSRDSLRRGLILGKDRHEKGMG